VVAAVLTVATTSEMVVPQAAHRPAVPTAFVSIAPMTRVLALGMSTPPTTAFCRKTYHFSCYKPFQLERAYDLPPLYKAGYDGLGRTIVIVDAYGSPTIGHDLGVFDRTFGLPNPPSLRVIQPAGKFPLLPDHPGWASETTLDVEWSHAIAPGASILLVETPKNEDEGTSGFPQIVEAENYVIDHNLGDVISQSFGATEETFPSAKALLNLRSANINADKHHVTVLAASSDAGATDSTAHGSDYYTYPVVDWPASDPLVTNLGGTLLHLNAAGDRTSPDSVWNDTYNAAVQRFFDGSPAPTPTAGGGGLSIFFARPEYQSGEEAVVGSHRGVPDLSMSAACAGQVDLYQSFPGTPTGWSLACGTSEASPEFAGIVAIADQYAGRRLGLINPAIYAMAHAGAPGIVDVTRGNNTVSFKQDGRWYKVVGFDASPGYDLASGLGTVDAALFVPELSTASRHQ
jgi:subtilase family serine protease